MQKQTVSERALIQRINRRIGGYDRKTCTVWGERLRTNSNDRWYLGLGRYYTVDIYSNGITGTHLHLEAYGREVGALADWEVLADEVRA